MQKPGLDAEKQKEFLSIIGKHATRLGAIIEDLLSLSRIEQDSDVEQIDMEEIDVQSILKESVELCQSQAVRRGIGLNLDASELLRVSANSRLLSQAVMNLIDNAVKYSPVGTSVSISASREEDWVCIRVKDEGPGIAHQHLARLFERFYRIDKARSRSEGGTGLGLSIVKHIALAHGGRVDVQSQIGVGTAFYIYIPVHRRPISRI